MREECAIYGSSVRMPTQSCRLLTADRLSEWKAITVIVTFS